MMKTPFLARILWLFYAIFCFFCIQNNPFFEYFINHFSWKKFRIYPRAIKILFFFAVNGTNVARLLSPAFKTLLTLAYEWTVYALVGQNENHPIRCLLSVAERRCDTMFGLLVTRAIGRVRFVCGTGHCSEFVDDMPQPKCLLYVCVVFAVGAERKTKLCAGVFDWNWIDEVTVLHVAWLIVLHLLRCIRFVWLWLWAIGLILVGALRIWDIWTFYINLRCRQRDSSHAHLGMEILIIYCD